MLLIYFTLVEFTISLTITDSNCESEFALPFFFPFFSSPHRNCVYLLCVWPGARSFFLFNVTCPLAIARAKSVRNVFEFRVLDYELHTECFVKMCGKFFTQQLTSVSEGSIRCSRKTNKIQKTHSFCASVSMFIHLCFCCFRNPV